MQELGLEEQRSQVLLDMQRLFASWDGTAENGMRVIAENKKYIDQFQALNAQEAMPALSSAENGTLLSIIKQQKRVVCVLRHEKADVLQQAKQLNLKNKIIDSYVMMRKPPVFLDRGI